MRQQARLGGQSPGGLDVGAGGREEGSARRSSGFEANAISHVIVDFIFFSLAKWIAFTEKRFVQYGRNDKPTS